MNTELALSKLIDSWQCSKFLKNKTTNVILVKIAHVAPVIHPVPPITYGGTERVVADLIAEQIRRGHEVVLFAADDSTLGGVERIGAYSSLAWHEARRKQVPAGLAAVLQAMQLADIQRLAAHFDVIHLHGSAHASGLLAEAGTPVFRTIHWRADEADHEEHFRQFPDERIIAISAHQAKAVPEKSLAGTVHHGLPLDRYEPGQGSGNYLAFIGRMSDQKRPDRAIEIARGAKIPLRLAGPVDPGDPSYFARLVKPQLNKDIQYIGSIGDAAKQSFLGSALALLFPIDWPEPFGLVMIEAMACGTPVIGWRHGSVPEVIEDGLTGIIVDSVSEVLARVDEVKRLDRPYIRRRFEQRFAASRMARQICRLYEEAL